MLSLIIVLVCFVLIVLDRTQVFATGLQPVTNLLYYWVVLLGAWALLLGAANVVGTHVRNVQAGQTGWPNSLALLLTFFIVLVAGLVAPGGTMSPPLEWIFTNLIAPGQAALFAVLVFFMGAAAYQYLRIDRRGGAWLLAGTLLMLISQLPALSALLPTFVLDATVWLLTGPAMAAVRGVLLGTSLALLLVGLRTVLGRS